jgi:hypothetical protein
MPPVNLCDVECLLRTVRGEGVVTELDSVGWLAVAMQTTRMSRGLFALSIE